jgi:hypothetical protein
MEHLRCTVILAGALLALGGPSRSSETEHLVTPQKLQDALAARGARRQRDLAEVDRLLSSETANRLASQAGHDLGRLREALPVLQDAELHDLAMRASRLETDPTAGLTHDVEELLIIFLIVGLLIIIIKSV